MEFRRELFRSEARRPVLPGNLRVHAGHVRLRPAAPRLPAAAAGARRGLGRTPAQSAAGYAIRSPDTGLDHRKSNGARQIRRATYRARVYQYLSIPATPVSLKQKQTY